MVCLDLIDIFVDGKMLLNGIKGRVINFIEGQGVVYVNMIRM